MAGKLKPSQMAAFVLLAVGEISNECKRSSKRVLLIGQTYQGEGGCDVDENAAASLALDAANTLEGIGEDVAQLKGANSTFSPPSSPCGQTNVEGQQLIARDADLDRPTFNEDSNWVTEVHSSVEVPP